MPMQGILASAGMKPTTPTIGTATDGGTGTTVSVAFTPSTYIGKGTITYTATSSPGGLTGTSSGSPITVSGLTTGTAYTFTVKGTTNYGVVSDNSAASNSVTPASPSSFDSIATFTPNGVTSVTFSSIPSTYKSLQIRFNMLSGVSGSTAGNIRLQFNGDTGSNYSWHRLYGDGTSVLAEGVANTVSIISSGIIYFTYPLVGAVDIIDYASTTKNKTTKAFSGYDTNGTSGQGIFLHSGNWRNTAAINSITVFSGSANAWGAGSTIALYGVK